MNFLHAQPKHTQFLYDLYCDKNVQKGHGIHHPIPGPRWRDVIQGLYEGWQHIYIVFLGVAPVAHIGLQDWSPEDRRAELSFAIHPSFQKQQIGSRMVKQFVDEVCIKELSLACIWARTPSYNLPSRKVMEKAGLVQSGELKDYYRYSGSRHSQIIYTRTR